MDEQLRRWLELPADAAWPPDHYVLLGLVPGQGDADLIERRVLERMERLRPHQLLHPEPVTEGMNRLAQALITLTDPQARKDYDHLLLGSTETPQLAESLPPAMNSSPPPIEPEPLVAEPPLAPLAPAPSAEAVASPVVSPALLGPSPPPPASTGRLTAVKESPRLHDPQVRREQYARLIQSRRLLRVWDQLGNHLVMDSGQAVRRVEAVALIVALTQLRQRLPDAPKQLGRSGHPGHLVIALARQPFSLQTFRGLLPSQRLALAQDWRAGRELLRKDRDELRGQLQSRRRWRGLNRRCRRLAQFLRQHPDWFWLGLGTLALAIAVGRSFWVGPIGGR